MNVSLVNSSLANFPDGDYIAPFRYDGYNSGPFLFLPKYIIDNYDISAESFDSMGYFAAVSVDGFITLNNGILFYHTWDEYKTDYSGIMCEIYNVTFTPKS